MTVSVRRRFLFTIAANLLRALTSFVTGMLLARWLGPVSFGKMAFLLGTFVAVRQLLDMGTSTAFFTFMSQRMRSRRFVRGFFVWLGVQFSIPLVVISVLFPGDWIEVIWHGEQRGLVLLAFVAAFMQNSVWPIVQQAGESQRQTLRVQGISVAIVTAHLLAVTLLWVFGKLGLYAIFGAIALEYLLAAAVAHRTLRYSDTPSIDETVEPLYRQYLRYCLPLAPYAWVGFAYEFADRWLLQRYGGSVQQAYYAVSAQFAAIALIATTSILSIFWKEVAEAHHRGDHVRTGLLYRKVSRLLYLVGALVAGFFGFWTEDLLRMFLGAAYVGGATTLAIMFLYPIHQSMGQIGTTMLYATERVATQVIAGIVFMICSIGVSYLVLAPKNAFVPGLELASTGLALKMVVLQLVQVNVIAYLIARSCGWRFDWTYQPAGLLGCGAIGWLAHEAATEIAGNSWPLPVVMVLGGVLYMALAGLFLYALPSLAGMTRADLLLDVGRAWRRTALGLKLK